MWSSINQYKASRDRHQEGAGMKGRGNYCLHKLQGVRDEYEEIKVIANYTEVILQLRRKTSVQ